MHRKTISWSIERIQQTHWDLLWPHPSQQQYIQYSSTFHTQIKTASNLLIVMKKVLLHADTVPFQVENNFKRVELPLTAVLPSLIRNILVTLTPQILPTPPVHILGTTLFHFGSWRFFIMILLSYPFSNMLSSFSTTKSGYTFLRLEKLFWNNSHTIRQPNSSMAARSFLNYVP